ncbi:endonuclease/exonuclease/phosphatase family protein [Actinomadura sp. 3N407]|uniref:endonuclease/exonuclease/phosphatase family protein n=1 Tax=Actinomadura sp. 3N407 TaxID=3457423 RepID=UPI003FCE0058
MKARVLTFNTLFRGRSRARLGALAQLMEQSDYDVVCLQEVISPRNLAHLRHAARSYPHTAHAATFPVVRGGLVTLSRWPITRRYFQPFTPTRPARLEWLLRKGALFTRVHLPDGFLTVVNTHLSANMDMHWAPSNAYTKAEESELRELAALIGRIDPAEPMVVMGDFNVPRDYSLFKDFASTTGLQDALADDTEPTYRPEYADIKPIDQILTRQGMDATPRLVFKEKIRLPDGRTTVLSDHYGIDATLTARRPPP